ncbi:bifunctional UDP-sugar hydrolase/5'-nucleotidase [Desulfosporosinus sp. BICA1-9]|uniref:bifunctional metallophosphatase/5'-nucleotidase n=1 Tax=Desulfosporosinus sp. BICA1-9 TaxID=1531958 RepID=UPI0005F0DA23|nr:bifunctional UDP-sugar hydrolase/5'-nucleotidase [Desulfosporosinus sp. BICA1-9]KJS47779.1 MAG: metallophosphoesterase [Peptococcaceae bacterium BRH_c23]KJS81747.1 MAG: metallophosphoesterase [Desulfosporosinus sp. BICA1-9]HBW34555.1 bifunctional metallophosphatase/5'-nucleotidase [Desulfosporosinus sp.]
MTIIWILGLSNPATSVEKNGKTLTILFTNDLHDHFLPFDINQKGAVSKFGGYAQLQSAINQEKLRNPNSILLDSGDFSMGTLFQSIYASDAPELRIMGQMGYDVVTLGNHEFDFRAKGLAESLSAAKKSGDKIPQLVASNFIYPSDKKGNLSDSLSNLQQAMLDYGVKDYTVLDRSGLKIGVFGLLGKDAASKAPMAEVEFTDAVENAQRVVKILKQTEKVDLIICLSHLGTSPDPTKSEDELLAQKVPELNIIISSHTHTKLTEPIVVGETIIGSAGKYGENLGVIDLIQSSEHNWNLNDYMLKQIDHTYKPDPDISQKIDYFKSIVQEKYLDHFGMEFDEVLATSAFDFVPTPEIGKQHAEDTLGNLISDAYIYAVKKAEGVDYEPVAVAIVPAGTIRSSFVKGNISVADAFSVSSLGIGPDLISGYPLISVYLTGKELKTACEVDASIAPIMEDAQLYMSGLNFTFNPNRLILNKVTDTILQKPDGLLQEIDDQELYRVVVGLYSAQMLSVVGDKSLGLLSIVPKTKDGTPITDYEAHIITDKTSGRNNELKEWFALAEYLKSFDKVNGIAQVPEYYQETQQRKIVEDNKNLSSLIKNPNRFAFVAVAAGILMIAGIALVMVKLLTRAKRREQKKEKGAAL